MTNLKKFPFDYFSCMLSFFMKKCRVRDIVLLGTTICCSLHVLTIESIHNGSTETREVPLIEAEVDFET